MTEPAIKPMTLNVRVSGTLGAFVAENVSAHGAYDNVSEYVRDLIRRDKERVDREAFDRLKAELQHAFAQPEDRFSVSSAQDFISRAKKRTKAA
jgi:antitoxin ParD1/3/4